MSDKQQRPGESLADHDERRADENEVAAERLPVAEEALTQIQHIAHDGTLYAEPRYGEPNDREKALLTKVERISNIAEAGEPDEDWQPPTPEPRDDEHVMAAWGKLVADYIRRSGSMGDVTPEDLADLAKLHGGDYYHSGGGVMVTRVPIGIDGLALISEDELTLWNTGEGDLDARYEAAYHLGADGRENAQAVIAAGGVFDETELQAKLRAERNAEQ